MDTRQLQLYLLMGPLGEPELSARGKEIFGALWDGYLRKVFERREPTAWSAVYEILPRRQDVPARPAPPDLVRQIVVNEGIVPASAP